MSDEDLRAERYHEMHRYREREDLRGCLQGGPHHPNQYFNRDKGYWICPDCGDTSRKHTWQFLGTVLAMLIGSALVMVALFWLGVLR